MKKIKNVKTSILSLIVLMLLNHYFRTNISKELNLENDYLISFPRQSLKKFTFRVKSSDSIFFLLGLSPIIN